MTDTPRTDANSGQALCAKGLSKDDHLYANASGPFVHADFARTLERELAAITKERDDLVKENARIIANHGCARNQGTTQFCAEVVAVQKERDELREKVERLEWLSGESNGFRS
jgi:ubiquinone biosynthesis protein UbiJ